MVNTGFKHLLMFFFFKILYTSVSLLLVAHSEQKEDDTSIMHGSDIGILFSSLDTIIFVVARQVRYFYKIPLQCNWIVVLRGFFSAGLFIAKTKATGIAKLALHHQFFLCLLVV